MLSQLPNIGKELERRLDSVGIHDRGELEEIGSIGVLKRLNAMQTPGCLNMLYALEGAIQGIRWHYLPQEEKDYLKAGLKAAINSAQAEH
ncbi:MAG: TfoX/Sxy family protein [Candidatus Marinimicrobia bacterium]|nr:TfoX/Sxy family protein [Candidatus Neomarinimicrobiota bacterium]